jgi:hypothetical protein
MDLQDSFFMKKLTTKPVNILFTPSDFTPAMIKIPVTLRSMLPHKLVSPL